MPTSLSERRQAMVRVREIAQVATRHGFGYLFERRPLRRRPPDELSQATVGRHLREMLDELGPTFVKFGQLLSTRPDLVPEDVAAELRQLRDSVSPFSFDEVQEVIRAELGGEVGTLYSRFDPIPIAAASIGQVHVAELQSGRRVAVKVQRPSAPRRVEADLTLLYQIARMAGRRIERLQFIDTVAVVDEFARSIRRELDYRIEARNAEMFRRNFTAEPRVAIPKVYWTYSSERVLTLEWLEGPKLGDLDLTALPMDERRRLALLMADTWLEMIFRHGMFHGDPHPANLFALADGRLGLVDFGQIGTLSEADMRRLTALLLDCVNQNVDALPRRLHDLGVRFNRQQEEEFRLELREIFYRYHGASLGEIDPLQVIRESFGLIYRMHLRLPSRFALLDKTLATLGSVGTELYPDFNVFEVAEPYAADLVARRYSPGALLERGREHAETYGDLILDLPHQVHDALDLLREGEMEMTVRVGGLEELIAKADVITNRLVVALVLVGTVIGSSIIGVAVRGGTHVFGVQILATLGFAVATVLGIALVISIMRSGKL
jgi:ubiquinone biosynthesis protein